ncbi:2-oxo acid dehydrogenase subunit E2 [Cryobacterium sp. TmT2-59]|uniref:dihydrolipoamide acetyltransferase family protein n=1 Tax=Cryobacterium sp. TmT2-59 TaxID=1259264 RepID=UPI00106C1A5E|nr:dihydrolipoamide acetyltransferase family protein [Cryobacterium sp. TmT2-59]TFC80621.1 2-oxo acid dehydrogenase subunit E2 [Cryobacterium sp. TmT2-59]
MIKVFRLPDLGEGLTESEIVAWRIAPGDTVELNQLIADVETAKAVVELPSPFAGVVSELHQQPGTVVHVGEPIVSFEVAGAEAASSASSSREEGEAQGRQANLVGYGPAVERGGRPQRRARAGATDATGVVPGTAAPDAGAPGVAVPGVAAHGVAAPDAAASDAGARVAAAPDPAASGAAASAVPVPDVAAPDVPSRSVSASASASLATVSDSPSPVSGERPRSTPPVRALARSLGVDLTRVTGTGPTGLITREDVEAWAEPARAVPAEAAQSRAEPAAPPAASVPGARESRSPIRSVRKHTAEAMVRSAFTAPHATEFLTVDVTPTVELIEVLKRDRSFAGARIGILAVVAKALCLAVARTPEVNTRWDEAAAEIVQFHYVNLGIAAATPRGLLVPTITDADRLSLADLAAALAELTAAARAGTTSPAALRGGTLSITNIGFFGIDAGTPILPPGEAVILAIGAIRPRPWEYRGEIALRQVMTLSLSFDHRLVDGEQGARFLTDIAGILANPGLALTLL